MKNAPLPRGPNRVAWTGKTVARDHQWHTTVRDQMPRAVRKAEA